MQWVEDSCRMVLTVSISAFFFVAIIFMIEYLKEFKKQFNKMPNGMTEEEYHEYLKKRSEQDIKDYKELIQRIEQNDNDKKNKAGEQDELEKT